MSGPVAIPGSRDIHLDALLAWAWLVHHPHVVERDCISRQTLREDVLSFRGCIPLAVAQLGIHEVALCTAWQFPGTAKPETMRWTRRKNGTDRYNRARTSRPSTWTRCWT